jgi:hypothetical protein
MPAFALTVSTGTALVHSIDFVQDVMTATLPIIGKVALPFLWTVDTKTADVVAGINAYIADPSITVTPNGHGLIFSTGATKHPQAEITGHDMDNNMLQFRWVGGPYTGDCAVPFVFTTSTAPADFEAAITAILEG